MGTKTDVTNDNVNDNLASILGTLFRTKRGRMIGLMGLLYTSIVSVTLTLFYFIVGVPETIVTGGLYSSITAFITYSRTPHSELTPVSVFIFAILPLIMTVVLILSLLGLSALGVGA